MKYALSVSALALTASAASVKRGEPNWGQWSHLGSNYEGWYKHGGPCNADGSAKFKHVAVFSVDGMHASDLTKYLARGPSNFTKLIDHGYTYSNAFTTFPSDSFPGTLAQSTGALPPTTGVWYDDIWDRSVYAPSSGCKGAPGAQVTYDETVDYNSSLLFSGGVDPTKCPQKLVNGKCINILPHLRPRVNTIWELAVTSGLKTAYTDKHPSYDILRGQSGTGFTTGYFPEINSDAIAYTANVSNCIKYDTLHVNAFLNYIDGQQPANSEGSLSGAVPSLWGGNFQSVSVGQKTKGYMNNTALDFTPDLLSAFQFVDNSLGLIINKLKAKNLYNDTLIIVASKHGQAPINPNLFKEVDPDVFTKTLGVPTQSITFDDVALIFLNKTSDLSKAVANLQANKTSLRIDTITYGANLTAMGYGNPATDPAVPDIIVQPVLGTIYSTSKKKIAEHGGGTDDDRHVTCFASNPRLVKKTVTDRVDTKQVAVTVLKALGLDPSKLQGAVIEKTVALSGF